MKKIITLIIIIVSILIGICYFYYENKSKDAYEHLNLKSCFDEWNQENMERFIVGHWEDGFPASAGPGFTYDFTDDYKIYFKNYTTGEHESVNGLWKLEGYKISVKIDGVDDWKVISDLRSCTNYWHPTKDDIPVNITILMIKDGIIMHYVNDFFKMPE